MSNFVNYTYWAWEAAVSKEFCDSSLVHVDWKLAKGGEIRRENAVVDTEYRRTDVLFQNFMQPLGCVAHSYMQSANVQAGWNFILTGQEDTQIARYKSVDNGFYDWHMDAFPPKDGIQRKLTCVILLNDPSEFEGGVLQFKGMEERVVLPKIGSIVVFPSFIEHRVTPVTKGVRYTAVVWGVGPSFK